MRVECGRCPQCLTAIPRQQLTTGVYIDDFARRTIQCPFCGDTFEVDRMSTLGWKTVYYEDGA